MRIIATVVVPLMLATVLGACASATIAVKEQFGFAKREQLVARVEDARDSQEAAAKQFESALDEFIAVTGAPASELESRYRSLNRAYERSEDRAGTVRSRIRDVERVADALFAEWERELDQYSDASLRARSEAQLASTRARYAGLRGAMGTAASKMDPVLAAFKDRVLFLKHNLNAQAIASLQAEVGRIETDVDLLVREMQEAIAQANAFIEQMRGPG